MDLIAKPSGGSNIIARPQALAQWYPTGTVRPVNVEVYWRYEGEPVSAAQLIGIFSPTAEVQFPFNPLVDRNVILSTVAIAANGTRSVRELADAFEQTLVFQRETAAPTVLEVRQLVKTSAHTKIALAIDGFSALAIKRRVRTADDVDMSVNLTEQEFEANPGDVLPRVIYLDRDDLGTGSRTIFVTIAHSSGGDYGAESDAQPYIYADDGGVGGSHETAEGDPFGQLRFDA